MKFTLTIGCDNAAFSPDPLLEVARILKEQAIKLKRNYDQGTWSDTLYDENGNRVGTAKLEAP